MNRVDEDMPEIDQGQARGAGVTVHTSCPICAGDTRKHCVKRALDQDWQIRRCRSCGHGFVANRPSLEMLTRANAAATGEGSLGEFNAARYEDRRDCADMAATIARLASGKGGDALDVGSGDGSYSFHLWKRGYRPVMIDLDPRGTQATRVMFGSRFERALLEDFAPPERFDAILMSQVLEHALDPLDWLRRARALLKPAGVLAVGVPNFAGVYRLLGARDPFLIPPVHVNYFTAQSLRFALEREGLRVIRIDTRSSITTHLGGRALGSLISASWNLASACLNPTRFGVILRVFAAPK